MIKCDPRARAKCPDRYRCGSEAHAYFVEGSECDKFNQKVLEHPMTNAQKIRAMSDEELVPVIMCPYSIEPDLCNSVKTCNECCLEWLKSPAEE